MDVQAKRWADRASGTLCDNPRQRNGKWDYFDYIAAKKESDSGGESPVGKHGLAEFDDMYPLSLSQYSPAAQSNLLLKCDFIYPSTPFPGYQNLTGCLTDPVHPVMPDEEEEVDSEEEDRIVEAAAPGHERKKAKAKVAKARRARTMLIKKKLAAYRKSVDTYQERKADVAIHNARTISDLNFRLRIKYNTYRQEFAYKLIRQSELASAVHCLQSIYTTDGGSQIVPDEIIFN